MHQPSYGKNKLRKITLTALLTALFGKILKKSRRLLFFIFWVLLLLSLSFPSSFSSIGKNSLLQHVEASISTTTTSSSQDPLFWSHSSSNHKNKKNNKNISILGETCDDNDQSSKTDNSDITAPTTPTTTTNNENNSVVVVMPSSDYVVATRLHLGKASTPPTQESLNDMMENFLKLSTGARRAAIAVDSSPKIPGYSLQHHVELAYKTSLEKLKLVKTQQQNQSRSDQGDATTSSTTTSTTLSSIDPPPVDILPVTPWGNFLPALNALVTWACRRRDDDDDDGDTCDAVGTNHNNSVSSSSSSSLKKIVFLSAETNVSPQAIQQLCQHVDPETTLVAGAVLPGHDYYHHDVESNKAATTTTTLTTTEEAVVPLTGRTTPWNTLCVWNVEKLALTGFPLVSEGVIANEDGSQGPAGVEEVAAIAVLQKMLPPNKALAKLVPLEGIVWTQDWSHDEERRKWHEMKMKSKVTRAARHLELLQMEGSVIHYAKK